MLAVRNGCYVRRVDCDGRPLNLAVRQDVVAPLQYFGVGRGRLDGNASALIARNAYRLIHENHVCAFDGCEY
jgi:hypothetical protein